MGDKSHTRFMILYITLKYVRCVYFLLLVLCGGRQVNACMGLSCGLSSPVTQCVGVLNLFVCSTTLNESRSWRGQQVECKRLHLSMARRLMVLQLHALSDGPAAS